MTSKQLGEFADQKTLQDYAELHGLEYAWEGTSAFRKRRRLARVSPEHYQLATVGTEHRIGRVLPFSSAIQRAEIETRRRVGSRRRLNLSGAPSFEKPKRSVRRVGQWCSRTPFITPVVYQPASH